MPFQPYISTSAVHPTCVLPTLQETLMCIYFHPNSHLLSSAPSRVYESVHLPRGVWVHLVSLLLSLSLVKHFFKMSDTYRAVKMEEGCVCGEGGGEVMYTSNTSIAWTSLGKTNEQRGQVNWSSGFSHGCHQSE